MSGAAGGPEDFRRCWDAVRAAVGQAVVGQEEALDLVLACLFADGHCLIEGVPGVGKTLLVRSLAQALGLQFTRIQFTPDLMPADVVGTDVLAQGAGERASVEFRPGPVFGNLVLADEINRATPKTQSALLQAMEEREVTVGRKTHELPRPFLVLATQNAIEMEGTYPLPEAQLDRFLLKVVVRPPRLDDLLRIVERTTGGTHASVPRVADPAAVLALQRLVREVVVAPHLRERIGRLVLSTNPGAAEALPVVRRAVRHGASPRAAQALTLAAKVRALSRGRAHVAEEDLAGLVVPALRHRILLNFEGEADGITAEQVAQEVAGV